LADSQTLFVQRCGPSLGHSFISAVSLRV